MKAVMTITLENGILNYTANMGVNDAVTILETVKLKLLQQATGGYPGRPPEPDAPVNSRFRSPGLQARRVDDGR